MEVSDLQIEIKSLINRLGIKQKEASKILLYTLSDDELEIDELCENQFYEKFKKQLSRQSTSIDILEEYLSILTLDEKSARMNLVMPVMPREVIFTQNFKNRMTSISLKIDADLISKNEQ